MQTDGLTVFIHVLQFCDLWYILDYNYLQAQGYLLLVLFQQYYVWINLVS